MTWSPINQAPLQYAKNAGGAAASGYYLKLYASGTTTPILMATDSTGGTTLAKCQLDSFGYPINSSGDVFVPHVDQSYKIAFYENEVDADNNTLASAVWVVDALTTSGTATINNSNGTTLTPAQWVDRQPQTFDTVALLSAATELNVGDYVIVKNYSATNESGPMFGRIVANGTGTADGGRYINLASSTTQFEQSFTGYVNIKHYGAETDGTDQYSTIASALTYVRSIKGKLYFPSDRDAGTTDYTYSQTIEHGASEVVIEGESNSVRLEYTGTGTGVACKITPGGTSIERWGLKNITLFSTTGAIGFDYTGGTYGSCVDVEFNYTAANAQMLYATGNSGAGPYGNKFDGLSFFGSAGRTQDAIVFKSDNSGNLADGPNANHFSNLKRCASLRRLINMVSGTGNLFSNVAGESIEDALIVLNEVPSFSDSGTATSVGNFSLTDTSKTWSTVPGDPLNFVNSQVTLTSGIPNETRRITSNTVDTLTLNKPWSQDPGSTPTYQISKSKAVKNMFVNIRQEGLNTSNPDGIRCVAGAKGNEFRGLEIGSLDSGVIYDDQAQDQTNKIEQGDLTVFQYVVENPGASANQEVILRSTYLGGIRSGSNMAVEYVEAYAIGYTAGTATITVDHGGTAAGNGDDTTVCVISSVCSEAVYVTGDKIMRDTTNHGIYCNLTTDGSFGAATDLIINIGVRIQ